MKELIENLASVAGVSGDEGKAVIVAEKELARFGKTYTNTLGSLMCEVLPHWKGKKHILLDAHIDEIGFIVTGIDDKGFLKIDKVGGIDRRMLLASEVVVHGKEDLFGVISCKAPHLENDDDRKKCPDFSDLAIDIGMSKEQAEKYVSLGDRVTLKGKTDVLLNGQIVSKALDDRSCCAVIIRTLEMLKEQGALVDLDLGLTVAFTSFEETGGGGAKTSAFAVEPTHAVALDVSFAYADGLPKQKCGNMYGGAMIGVSPTLSKQASQKLVELAKKNNIPYQLEVMGGKTGTNGDEIVTSKGGVVTALLSLPIRNMHSPVEIVAPEDIENTAKLLCEYIKSEGGVL